MGGVPGAVPVHYRPQNRRAIWWAAIVLAILTGASLLVYRPSSEAFFVSDDYGLLSIADAPWDWEWKPTGRWFRPIGYAFWRLTTALFGLDPLLHHLANVGLNILVSLSLFLLGARLFESRVVAAAASLIFCLFPLHAEAVSWLSGRFDLLCALFSVLSAFFFLRAVDEDCRYCLVSSWGLLLLALLSKEAALSLPFLLALLCLKRQPWIPVKRLILLTGPAFALVAGFVCLRLFLIGHVGGYGVHGSLKMSTLQLLWRPWADFFFPVARPGQSPAWLVAGLSVVLLVMHGWILLRAGRRWGDLGLFIVAFYLSLLPLLNIVGVGPDLMGSRFYYLPSALVSLGLARVLWNGTRAGAGVVALYCAVLGGLLHLHTYPWKMAGKECRSILLEMARLPDGPKILEAIPDSIDGAYVFRNGLERAALLWNGQSLQDVCWRVQGKRGTTSSGACPQPPGTPRYRWDNGSFRPIPK